MVPDRTGDRDVTQKLRSDRNPAPRVPVSRGASTPAEEPSRRFCHRSRFLPEICHPFCQVAFSQFSGHFPVSVISVMASSKSRERQ